MDTILIIILFSVVAILAWALLGERKERVEYQDDQETDAEKVLRRRAADREIEESFPGRRKNDTESLADTSPDPSSVSTSQLQLPYPVKEIIPGTSRYRLYTRTLINAEVYAKRNEFTTAISLFQGVHNRIGDTIVRDKIEADIDYLERFRKALKAEEKKRAQAPTLPGQGGDEVRLKIDGNLPNTITINTADPRGLDPEKLAQSISQAMKDQLQSFQDDLNSIKNELDHDDKRNDEIENLVKELAEMRGRMEEIRNAENRDVKNLRNEAQEISELRKELNRLNDRLHQISRLEEQPPVPQEAKFQATIDPAPILELLDKLPKEEAPEPVDIPEPEQSVKDELTKKREEEDEGPEEIELLKDRDKDDFEDGLSDEDIFEKILSEEKKPKEDDGFEIIAERDKKEESEEITLGEDDVNKEDREFYKKLLNTDKRKRRELPVLKVSYDFDRLPDESSLARDKNLMSYSFYKYKPLLERANEYIKKRKVRDAINYYKMVMNQNIPPEFKKMIRKNINDLNEYLEKYLTTD